MHRVLIIALSVFPALVAAVPAFAGFELNHNETVSSDDEYSARPEE